MISASKEGIEGSGFNFLTTPYLGSAKFKSLTKEEINNTDDCAVFKFECLESDIQGNNVKGLEHQHVEWNPADDEDKLQKKVDRLGYIISHLIGTTLEEGKSIVSSVSAPNWSAYVTEMIKLVNEHKSVDRTDLSIKIMGNTYSKPKVNFPGYPAFMANKDSAPLTWSQSEIKENNAYLNGKSSAPTEMTVTEEIADITDAEF